MRYALGRAVLEKNGKKLPAGRAWARFQLDGIDARLSEAFDARTEVCFLAINGYIASAFAVRARKGLLPPKSLQACAGSVSASVLMLVQ
jgi:hypothetical protein